MVLQRYMYGTAFANRSGMLNGVSDQFVHDKRERHSYVSRDSGWIGINDKRPHLIRAARRSRYLFAKIIDVPVEYYDRMRVILAESDWPAWLGETAASEDQLLALLKPCPDDALKIWAVGKAVGDVKNTGPQLAMPV
jgi:hypothetical protein